MAKKPQPGILAIFSYLDVFCSAIEDVRDRKDFEHFQALSPTSYHEIEHASGFGSSPVRFFTLIGGLLGCTAGFALALWMETDYPLIVGGKTPGIYSFPAYVVIGFEMTILLGAIATVLGILIMGKVPNPFARVFDKRTTDDKFALFVPLADVNGPQAKHLQGLGAEEIKAIS